MNVELFPFCEYWWFYLSFTGFVLLLLSIDLGIFHRNAHAVSFKEASVWTGVWIALSLLFNFLLYQYALWKFPLDSRLMAQPEFRPEQAAWDVALQFLTGYLVEKSLSLDNIFVFVLIFGYFAVPQKYQHRVLFYGIIGAFIFRAIFIAIGSVLMQYSWVVLMFGVFLILTGIKILIVPEVGLQPEKNPLIRLFRRFVPVNESFSDQRFFIRKQGTLFATPLLVALIFVEITDVIFAVDSVPAIFALTNEPLVVFTSNVFAILGLRAMYFMLAGVIDKFHLLRYGLALVLIFVGLKMAWLNELFGGHFPILVSLVIISAIIAISIVLSLLITPKRFENVIVRHEILKSEKSESILFSWNKRGPLAGD